MSDRFSGARGGLVYRTGDVGRYRSDGTLEHLGRMDGQVKVRGHRIELGEIESRLRSHATLQDAAVKVHERGASDQRLVAYVVGREGQEVSASALRAHLRGTLPDFMVPSLFVSLDALPLSPNGKLDRKALPDPTPADDEGSGVAPTTPTEELLVSLWSGVLGRASVGVHDDFFALGGHSLAATQLLSRVSEALRVEMPLRALFEAPPPARFAERVEGVRVRERAVLQPAPRASGSTEFPLSYSQQRMWFHHQLSPRAPLTTSPGPSCPRRARHERARSRDARGAAPAPDPCARPTP